MHLFPSPIRDPPVSLPPAPSYFSLNLSDSPAVHPTRAPSTMRTVALISLLAASAIAAPTFGFQRRQLGGASLANGPNAIDDTTVNSGAIDEGVVKDTTSFEGAQIINPEGNTLVKSTENFDFHDNNVINPDINIATGGHGPTIVGNDNYVLPIGSGVWGGIVFKRQQLANAPVGVSNPTVNQGALTEGSTSSNLSADGALVSNPIGNSVTDVNNNSEVAGNDFVDSTFNTVSNVNGPAFAGDNGIFIPVVNEADAIHFDNGALLDFFLGGGLH
ncbi:hypothetical protein DL89DRAFT_76212 [Linderina pennispora]|uniref:Uncharacterized protein n=1 Tax=Linderina pennispora TaxID=61395 RepID=A0A1Y1VXQ8_9FUNG|nr:uncharacterized protein DL89DRAFT_76212 [Linderina pennispora]ORX66062.1 hypothetical protein DL89DRAFT_76212 [Linderina pennispora]